MNATPYLRALRLQELSVWRRFSDRSFERSTASVRLTNAGKCMVEKAIADNAA